MIMWAVFSKVTIYKLIYPVGILYLQLITVNSLHSNAHHVENHGFSQLENFDQIFAEGEFIATSTEIPRALNQLGKEISKPKDPKTKTSTAEIIKDKQKENEKSLNISDGKKAENEISNVDKTGVSFSANSSNANNKSINFLGSLEELELLIHNETNSEDGVSSTIRTRSLRKHNFGKKTVPSIKTDAGISNGPKTIEEKAEIIYGKPGAKIRVLSRASQWQLLNESDRAGESNMKVKGTQNNSTKTTTEPYITTVLSTETTDQSIKTTEEIGITKLPIEATSLHSGIIMVSTEVTDEQKKNKTKLKTFQTFPRESEAITTEQGLEDRKQFPLSNVTFEETIGPKSVSNELWMPYKDPEARITELMQRTTERRRRSKEPISRNKEAAAKTDDSIAKAKNSTTDIGQSKREIPKLKNAYSSINNVATNASDSLKADFLIKLTILDNENKKPETSVKLTKLISNNTQMRNMNSKKILPSSKSIIYNSGTVSDISSVTKNSSLDKISSILKKLKEVAVTDKHQLKRTKRNVVLKKEASDLGSEFQSAAINLSWKFLNDKISGTDVKKTHPSKPRLERSERTASYEVSESEPVVLLLHKIFDTRIFNAHAAESSIEPSLTNIKKKNLQNEISRKSFDAASKRKLKKLQDRSQKMKNNPYIVHNDNEMLASNIDGDLEHWYATNEIKDILTCSEAQDSLLPCQNSKKIYNKIFEYKFPSSGAVVLQKLHSSEYNSKSIPKYPSREKSQPSFIKRGITVERFKNVNDVSAERRVHHITGSNNKDGKLKTDEMDNSEENTSSFNANTKPGVSMRSSSKIENAVTKPQVVTELNWQDVNEIFDSYWDRKIKTKNVYDTTHLKKIKDMTAKGQFLIEKRKFSNDKENIKQPNLASNAKTIPIYFFTDVNELHRKNNNQSKIVRATENVNLTPHASEIIEHRLNDSQGYFESVSLHGGPENAHITDSRLRVDLGPYKITGGKDNLQKYKESWSHDDLTENKFTKDTGSPRIARAPLVESKRAEFPENFVRLNVKAASSKTKSTRIRSNDRQKNEQLNNQKNNIGPLRTARLGASKVPIKSSKSQKTPHEIEISSYSYVPKLEKETNNINILNIDHDDLTTAGKSSQTSSTRITPHQSGVNRRNMFVMKKSKDGGSENNSSKEHLQASIMKKNRRSRYRRPNKSKNRYSSGARPFHKETYRNSKSNSIGKEIPGIMTEDAKINPDSPTSKNSVRDKVSPHKSKDDKNGIHPQESKNHPKKENIDESDQYEDYPDYTIDDSDYPEESDDYPLPQEDYDQLHDEVFGGKRTPIHEDLENNGVDQSTDKNQSPGETEHSPGETNEDKPTVSHNPHRHHNHHLDGHAAQPNSKEGSSSDSQPHHKTPLPQSIVDQTSSMQPNLFHNLLQAAAATGQRIFSPLQIVPDTQEFPVFETFGDFGNFGR